LHGYGHRQRFFRYYLSCVGLLRFSELFRVFFILRLHWDLVFGIALEEHRGAGLFRYTVGSEPTLEAARSVQALCKEKGFDGAFIVAFRDGERIDLQEAVKLAHGR
jgi:adenosine/AMP kinase